MSSHSDSFQGGGAAAILNEIGAPELSPRFIDDDQDDESIPVLSTELLYAILNEIGAPEFLQRFIDDDQVDESIPILSKMKPEQVRTASGPGPCICRKIPRESRRSASRLFIHRFISYVLRGAICHIKPHTCCPRVTRRHCYSPAQAEP
jgi:hypothetical protein